MNKQLPEDMSVNCRGLTIHYLDWGNREATPIVLIHGICSNAHYWDFFAARMSDSYHVLALDQRGHGDSSRAESYGPRDYFSDLESFTEALDLPEFVLIGHSMGGINAIIYAARHPEMVSSLVIVDIGPEIGQAGRERMERERREEPGSFRTEEEAVSWIKSTDAWASEEFIRHQVKYSLIKDDNGQLVFKYDKKLMETDLRSPEWLWEYVAQLLCPVLLVHGAESDMLTLQTAETMAGDIPHCTIAEIERAGHGVPGDNTEAFTSAVLRFLAGR